MNVTKGFRRVPQFEDAYRDLFKHEPQKLPNRSMIELFDSFDNVIGRPFGDMTDAHKQILAAQAGQLSMHARAATNGTPLIQERISTPQTFDMATPRPQPAAGSGQISPMAMTPVAAQPVPVVMGQLVLEQPEPVMGRLVDS